MSKEQELVPWGWPTKIGVWIQNNWLKYKLTAEAWRKVYERQGGKCAGCLKELANPLDKQMGKFGLKPQVDHRHVEGRQCEEEDVRGLLCGECNRLLGQIQDDKALMERLVAYLKQHGDY